ncbi:proteasome-interacting protein cic1, partial [Teratosphaeriaceae sp. CCFEE 6253]
MALGKVFYKGGSKRPIPVSLEGKRQSVDEQGVKRWKLSEGGTKVTKLDAKPADVAREITRAVGSALVHLAPSTTTA